MNNFLALQTRPGVSRRILVAAVATAAIVSASCGDLTRPDQRARLVPTSARLDPYPGESPTEVSVHMTPVDTFEASSRIDSTYPLPTYPHPTVVKIVASGIVYRNSR